MATTPTRTAPPASGHADHDPSIRAEVPLAVWPVAQTSAQYQRAGRYLPETTRHPGKMLPALARRIVSEFSTPGQLVCDPMAGIGTTVVEAAAQDRRTVGVELEPRWATIARANLDHLLDASRRRLADLRVGDARDLPVALADIAGTIDVVVVSPPYGRDAGTIDKPAWHTGATLCDTDTLNYGSRDNLGHARGETYLTGMGDVYAAIGAVLRPGGLLVTVTKNTRRSGRLFDLAATTVALAQQAGFAYLQHVVALHAAVRNGGLVARPSFWQLTQLRREHARGEPTHLVVHEDVLLFRAPPAAAARTGE